LDLKIDLKAQPLAEILATIEFCGLQPKLLCDLSPPRVKACPPLGAYLDGVRLKCIVRVEKEKRALFFEGTQLEIAIGEGGQDLSLLHTNNSIGVRVESPYRPQVS
jgi:hypothetical protein